MLVTTKSESYYTQFWNFNPIKSISYEYFRDDYFGLTQAELNAIHALIHSQKKLLDALDPSIGGYNLGWNCGEIAGQSVWHCHAHLIPRRKGDVEFPKGGVRHVIPWKGRYEVKE